MTRFLYNVLAVVLTPVLAIRLLLRGIRNRDYLGRWDERFGFDRADGVPGCIWVHAVSVGEAGAAGPIIDHLLENETRPVLVTTMTPTGADQIERKFGERVVHRYLPFDLPWATRHFMQKHRPRVAVIMETELWPNLLHSAAQAGVPVVIANMRLSERSAAGYRRILPLIRPALSGISALLAQTEQDRQRAISIGAPPDRVHVTGSIKFEIRHSVGVREVGEVLRRELGANRKIFVAGSTHGGEDEVLLRAYAELKPDHPELLLVLVPRHPERFQTVVRLAERTGETVSRTSYQEVTERTDVYVVDTMGELLNFYAAADLAFTGGSLVEVGGHNILEPCSVGAPVIYGPHMFNFAEISDLVELNSAGIRLGGAEDLVPEAERLLADADLRFRMGEAGEKLVEDNRGALQKTLARIPLS